ncbi:MAG: glycosyltransferase family 4 protein [Chloroflexota bacterium]
MRVCLISVEIFAWGKYGGFGRATRLIGRELARRGVEVTAVVPRRGDQAPVEMLDGIRVLGFSPRKPFSAIELLRQANADIYHSEEPSMGTYLAMRCMPDRKHVVTFRDPRDAGDWYTEFRLPSVSPAQVISNWLYEDNPLVHLAVRRAHARFAAAQMIIAKARRKYRLPEDPLFLPTPVDVPAPAPQKAPEPTVCFVSRWDKRKRPEIFFDLVKQFPEVRFIAAGKSRDPEYDAALRRRCAGLPNLELPGFIDQFQSDRLTRLLGSSWILANTAAREGLPNAFIEAAAHACAILSAVDPDGFASSFGWHVQNDDFAAGLRCLLENNAWRERAERGYRYVYDTFSLENAIDRHLAIYEQLTGLNRPVQPPSSPVGTSL